jgi:protein-S-isoprenylcysteine O-methyltransferase Ste14
MASVLHPRNLQNFLLVLLAAVFTVGLTFATVELPYLIDGALQGAVTTPNLDSHADQISVLKTELFIAHFHLRLVGYCCFALMVLLIIAGFATRRTGLAAVGAIGFMLPVFAQFAGVMFFLAGLGMLNILWLPVLDISFELQRLGLIIRAPYDLLRWLFGQVGINGYWPIVYFFLGSGLLLFFTGTFAWLSARSRKLNVADSWVYRISRHPQYLGWILWSYGVYLLLLRGLYPRRSWGIDASLPWLLSTLVIVGVAMLEELNMRKRHGEVYEAYRRSAPFLVPVPRFVAKFFALPTRLLFKKKEPVRKREVASVVAFYTVLLIGASAFFYGRGLDKTIAILSPERERAQMTQLVAQLVEEPNSRAKFFVARRLAAFGGPAVDYFVPLLEDDQAEVRDLAAEFLRRIPSERAVPALVAVLGDDVADVRGNAVRALGVIGSQECVEPLMELLDDPEPWIRQVAMRSLAQIGVEELLQRAEETSRHQDTWIRVSTVESLGILGSERGLSLIVERLNDHLPWVRRSAVVALLKIGSPEAREALMQASRDEDWEVRLYAVEALKQLPR